MLRSYRDASFLDFSNVSDVNQYLVIARSIVYDNDGSNGSSTDSKQNDEHVCVSGRYENVTS